MKEIDALHELFSTAEEDLARASRDSNQLFAQQLNGSDEPYFRYSFSPGAGVIAT